MAIERNKPVSEETFGESVPSPSLKRGSVSLFGYMANDRVIPERGVSVNVKTGYPVKGS